VTLRMPEPGEHSLEGPRRAQRSEHDGRTYAAPAPGEHPLPHLGLLTPDPSLSNPEGKARRMAVRGSALPDAC